MKIIKPYSYQLLVFFFFLYIFLSNIGSCEYPKTRLYTKKHVLNTQLRNKTQDNRRPHSSSRNNIQESAHFSLQGSFRWFLMNLAYIYKYICYIATYSIYIYINIYIYTVYFLGICLYVYIYIYKNCSEHDFFLL